ncbi:OmpA family protein [Pseudacidovorax intermedius]|uniref:OmpA family protein n=1 Tax=Pseudacidovorax intermedius TaxID=433924 RepID=UPI0026E9E323|nr:OmpA family protein [Pseudacidovorax intermedius]
MSTPDDDSQQRFALGLVFVIIALIVATTIGAAVYHYGMPGRDAEAAGTASTAPAAPATGVAVITETVVAVVPEGASVRVEGGVVKFYFATGSADIAPGAAEALALVLQGVQNGRKAVISGYHDTTGDPAKNEELAKQRAITVRDVLVGLGVAEDKVTLEKPAVAAAGQGDDAAARRVEVKLVD